MLEVRLLGTFLIKAGTIRISLASRPAQSLFAFLILNAGTAYRREKLAGQLWPDSTEETARDYLRHALWRMRKALQAVSSASYLHADDLTISFDASADYWLDAAALQKLSEDALADEMISVLSAYIGELLPGFYDEWVVLEREHLQAVYERKMGRLLDLLQKTERWSEVLEWGEKWIAFGQKPEAAFRALMTAQAAQDDLSKVAAAYERCRKSMAGLGIEPSEETRHLYEELKAGHHATQHSPKAKTSMAARPQSSSNLPVPLTSFIGREKELAEITRLIREQRLVTLVGPGGVGKTRLAVEAARKLVGKFQNGVWWIDLVGLSDSALVSQAVLLSAGVHELPNRPAVETLIEHFASKQSLLVLDNCEHLISACAQLAARLLSRCRNLRILATSREALDILSEITWTVPSLSLPEAQETLTGKTIGDIESVHLFMERVASSQSKFELTEKNARAVMQICTRLSGIPLAIELAAARVRMMSVEEIARRLDDSFDLLTAGDRTALPRHQTLRATIDWSYDLLSQAERVLFRRLSVFAGGFTLEAAEGVAADDTLPRRQIVDLLGQLINKSLVSVQPASNASAGQTRYAVLETIREYARRKSDEARETSLLRTRHLEFFCQMAELSELGMMNSRQTDWYQRLEADMDNLRDAMAWSMLRDQDAALQVNQERLELGLRLAGALPYFWERNYRREGLDRIKRMLSFSQTRGAGRAKCLMVLGFLHWASTEQPDARPYLEQAQILAQELGDKYTWAWSMGYLGAVLIALGEYDPAQHCLDEAYRLGMSLGDIGGNIVIWTRAFLGDIPFSRGENETARRLYQESVIRAKQEGDINSLTYSNRRLGYLALREREYKLAEGYFAESLRNNQEINHLQGINRCIAAFACLRAAEGELVQAVQLCAAVESFLSKMSASFFHWDETFFKDVLLRLRADLPQPAFDKAWARGLKMGLEEAVEFVLRGI